MFQCIHHGWCSLPERQPILGQSGRTGRSDYKEYIIDMLSSMISQDIWNTFIGHEELAFRVFIYGTHYIREEELGRS